MNLSSVNLRLHCRPIDFKHPTENLRLAQNLIQLMMRENGIGLAANQAGLEIRLFVMFVDREIFHCFNPEIISTSQEYESMQEGCLSFPEQRCEVLRPKSIIARYANARGQYQERELHGLAARCYQHELDHLNALTMHDRIGAIS